MAARSRPLLRFRPPVLPVGGAPRPGKPPPHARRAAANFELPPGKPGPDAPVAPKPAGGPVGPPAPDPDGGAWPPRGGLKPPVPPGPPEGSVTPWRCRHATSPLRVAEARGPLAPFAGALDEVAVVDVPAVDAAPPP